MNRKMVLLAVLLANAAAACAQTDLRTDTQAPQDKEQRREARKRMEALQDSVMAAEALASLREQDFVLEANRLSFKHGETAYVTSFTNFISLEGDKATIQIAPFNGGGPNGVGGVTLEGRALSIKLKTDRKGNVTFTMSVMGTGLSATVDITLPSNGYVATATVNPNFNSNRVTLYGSLLPAGKSEVYKGRAF